MSDYLGLWIRHVCGFLWLYWTTLDCGLWAFPWIFESNHAHLVHSILFYFYYILIFSLLCFAILLFISIQSNWIFQFSFMLCYALLFSAIPSLSVIGGATWDGTRLLVVSLSCIGCHCLVLYGVLGYKHLYGHLPLSMIMFDYGI